jgi:hypothetical protein
VPVYAEAEYMRENRHTIPAYLPRNLKSYKSVGKSLKHILLWTIWRGPTKNVGTTAKCKTKSSTWKMINLVFGQYHILIALIWIISVSEAVNLESRFFRMMVLLTIQT